MQKLSMYLKHLYFGLIKVTFSPNHKKQSIYLAAIKRKKNGENKWGKMG